MHTPIIRPSLLLFITFLLLQRFPLYAQTENPDWESGQAPKIDPGSSKLVQCPDALPSNYYSADHRNEKFTIYVPKGYDPADPTTTHGLIVFVDSGDTSKPPSGEWTRVLDQHKVFYIAPSNVGNKKPNDRRTGMAVLCVKLMQKYYPTIDPNKTYAAGISGGARIASWLGLNNSNVFQGTIQSCGSDFYKAVPRVAVTDKDLADTKSRDSDGYYGITPCSSPNSAREKVKFVLITGPKDFRHNFILDIFHGGFEAEGFKAKLIDVPNMGHQLCNGTALDEALTFIESP